MTELGYAVFDADGHYYEPYDCFTREIEAEFRDRTVRVVRGDDGLGRLYVGDRRMVCLRLMPTDSVSPPGALQGLFEGNTEFVPHDLIDAHDFPEMMKRDARLAMMDRQGVGLTTMIPSLGFGVEHELRDDPPLLYASLRAFNRWIEGEWGYGDDGRIIGVPLLSLRDLSMGIAELERVLDMGARFVHVRPGPAYGRSPADPYFDTFWARIEEAGVPVMMHVSNSGYNDWVSVHWGEDPNNAYHLQTPLQWALGVMPDRPIVDTLCAMVLHNLFGRFPALQIVSVENGSEWVAYLLKLADKAAVLGRQAEPLGGRLDDKPSAILRRHVFVTPFPEDDVHAAIELMGADRILFGSDWPHAEGLAEPLEYLDRLAGYDEVTVRKVMRDNLAGVLGIHDEQGVEV